MARPRTEERRDWLDKAEAIRHGAKTFTRYALPVASTVAQLAALINIEKKYFDTNNFTGTTSVSFTSGISVPVSFTALLPQGDGQSQCIGNSIKLLTLYFKLFLTQNNAAYTANPQNQCLRTIIFVDRESQGATPAASDLLENTIGANKIISPLNKAVAFAAGQTPRFQILIDRVFEIQGSGNAGPRFHEFYFSQEHKLGKDHHCVWTSDTHSINNTLAGHIYVIFLYGNETATGATPTMAEDVSNPPGVQWYSRITYTDD